MDRFLKGDKDLSEAEEKTREIDVCMCVHSLSSPSIWIQICFLMGVSGVLDVFFFDAVSCEGS